MSNDDIMKDSAGFAHLELGHLGSAFPGLSCIYDLTDICEVRDQDSQNNFPEGRGSHTPLCETHGFQGSKGRTEYNLISNNNP